MMSASTGFQENSPPLILDTWPVMEWLKDTGTVAERFDELLARAEAGSLKLVISRITVGEIFYVTARRYGLQEAELVLQLMDDWAVSIAEATEQRVLAAARLKASYPISYGDGFVAGLALELNAPVLTGDADFLRLKEAVSLRVEWMGA